MTGASGTGTDDLLGDLTPRQREVAQLVGRGLGTTDVATKLGISYWTARGHVYAIASILPNPDGLPALRLVRRWARSEDGQTLLG